MAHELVLTRLIDVQREKLWRCWTEPRLIVQWFTPPPWKTVHAETDVRPGGASTIVMKGPEGQEMPNRGVYLEVIKNQKLVFTDAYVRAWEPSAKPFFTGVLTFEDEGGPGSGKTRYTARAALDQGGLRNPREDGLPPGLGHRHRPDDGAGQDVIV
jgi:uncharacterized protein YndB with AHSA1/START domain